MQLDNNEGEENKEEEDEQKGPHSAKQDNLWRTNVM